jgi:hypothetical protein
MADVKLREDLLERLLATVENAASERAVYEAENAKLRQEVDQLKNTVYGPPGAAGISEHVRRLYIWLAILTSLTGALFGLKIAGVFPSS